MSEKKECRCKKTAEKGNRAVIVTVVICVVALSLLIGAMAVADPIAASLRRDQALETVKQSTALTVTAPLHSEKYPLGAESILTGEEAVAMRDPLLKVIENASFDGVEDSAGGFWDTSLVFYTDSKSEPVYLKSDGIYFVKSTRAYIFSVAKEDKADYDALLKQVEALLDEGE